MGAVGWNHRASAVVAVAAASQRPTACTPEEAEPPNADAGEITDKGYVNQRAVLQRRAAEVQALYAEPADARVIFAS